MAKLSPATLTGSAREGSLVFLRMSLWKSQHHEEFIERKCRLTGSPLPAPLGIRGSTLGSSSQMSHGLSARAVRKRTWPTTSHPFSH